MDGNFKVKCLDARGCNKSYTNGKIYEVVDGVFTDDDGYNIIGIDSFDEFNNMTSAMWELVEDSSDLRKLIKPCYVVVHRNGELRTVIETTEGMACVSEDGCYIKFDSLDNTLRNIGRARSDFDIVEVYGFSEYYGNLNKILTNNRELIWKREEKSQTQLKLEELEKKQREIADEMEKLRKEL